MKEQCRILMVEDSEDDALLIMRQVQKGNFDAQFERVETKESFMSALEFKKWDIILCDYKLPTFNGIEALSILKERGYDIPFIFVSGTMGEERAVEAMKNGARDYVMKGNLKRLVPAIERELSESKIRKDRKRIEEQIHFQALILNQISNAGIATNLDGNIVYWNNAAETLYGWTSEEVIGKKPTDFLLTKDSQMVGKDIRTQIDQTGSWRGEIEFNRKDGTTLPVLVSSSLLRNISGEKIGSLEISTDISERKRNEKLILLQNRVLKVLASDIPATQTVNELVAVIRQSVGYDAVGLRLKVGDDYPFVASLGYSKEFLKSENILTHRYPSGGLCRNADGTISLECTCGMILGGKADASNPLFTPNGSAWTNNSLPFLDIPPEADPRLHPRNRCIHVGFLSLALIPIRAGNDIIGLLHLADHLMDRFTPEIIEFFEGIGISIGVVLAHKQAEDELRKSNELLSLFVKHSPIYTFIKAITPTENRVLNVSDNIKDLTGITASEMLGKSNEDLFPAEFAAKITADDWSVVSNGAVLRLDEDLNGRNYTSIKFPIVQGEKTLLAGYTIDITERKRAAEKLIASENKFRLIVENIKEVFWISEPDWSKIYYVSPNYYDVWGEKAEKLYEHPFLWMDSIIEEDKEKIRSCIPETITKDIKEIIFPDYRIKKSDGTIIWISARAFPVFDSEGNPYRIAGIAEDITERKQGEDALKESKLDLVKKNNFISTILENLELGVAVNFMDSGVTEYINPAYSRVYGWPAEDMKDIESFFELIYPDPVYSEQQMKMVMEDINSGDPERMHWVDVRITTKTGEERFIEARNIPLPDQNLMISTAWDITERRRTEQALAYSEQQFRSLYENATIGIYRTTPTGKILMANPALVQMLGYSSFVELAARNLEEEGFEPSYERKYFKEQIEKNGTLVGVEGVWHRKDGVVINVRENAKAIRDSEGTMLFYDGTVEDITARKQAENLLQENNVRLDLAMSIANMAWWEMDITTGKVMFNKRKAEMLGYPPEQFNHYTDFMALVHPDDHDKAMNAMRRHLEGVHEKYEIEYRIKTQSGVYQWFYDIGCISKKDENGSPLKVSGLVLNITERKQAEEKLLISEIKYRSFFENSMDAIMLATDDGKILSANHAACRMFGYLEEELINGGRTRIMDVTDPKFSAFISERTLKGMARGELTLIRKDGTCFPSEISSALFETGDGQINTSIIIHDISERNQAQKELNQQIIELQDWHEVSVGREEKIIELKREINKLLTSSGKKIKYEIDE